MRRPGDTVCHRDNLEPNPEIRLLQSFRTIWVVNNLGSGSTKLFKYSRYYSWKRSGIPERQCVRDLCAIR